MVIGLDEVLPFGTVGNLTGLLSDALDLRGRDVGHIDDQFGNAVDHLLVARVAAWNDGHVIF